MGVFHEAMFDYRRLVVVYSDLLDISGRDGYTLRVFKGSVPAADPTKTRSPEHHFDVKTLSTSVKYKAYLGNGEATTRLEAKMMRMTIFNVAGMSKKHPAQQVAPTPRETM
jgi:hypothetical protein